MSWVGLEPMHVAAEVTLFPWLSLEKKQYAIWEKQGRTGGQILVIVDD
jgi:hypothetical protein